MLNLAIIINKLANNLSTERMKDVFNFRAEIRY